MNVLRFQGRPVVAGRAAGPARLSRRGPRRAAPLGSFAVTPTALAFRDVSVRHGDGPWILHRLRFEIASGERVAVLGCNGSGKTSLLQAAVGLLPAEGEIRIEGVPLDRTTVADLRRRIGFVFNVPEDQLLFPRVIDDVAFGLLSRDRPAAEAEERARAALAAVGAQDLAERSILRLSHGQKQRVALAGALVADPPLLLLDEPTAGLDPPARRLLARLLTRLPAALLVATHDLPFARHVCSRFLLLEEGHLVADRPDPAEAERRWAGE